MVHSSQSFPAIYNPKEAGGKKRFATCYTLSQRSWLKIIKPIRFPRAFRKKRLNEDEGKRCSCKINQAFRSYSKSLDYQCGEYRSRTDDLLHAMPDFRRYFKFCSL